MTTPDPHLTRRVASSGPALGIPFGGRPGRWNAITDVPGVEVGYVTLIEGSAVRTGVTAIHPGLARTGASGSHFSGDLFLAFFTANPGAFRPGEAAMSSLDFIPWERLDPYYEAVVQATEEAVVNALVANEDMTGRDGHRSPALPRDRVAGLLAAVGRLR